MTATEAAFRKLAKSRFLSRFRIVDFLMAWIDSQSNAGAPKASIARTVDSYGIISPKDRLEDDNVDD